MTLDTDTQQSIDSQPGSSDCSPSLTRQSQRRMASVHMDKRELIVLFQIVADIRPYAATHGNTTASWEAVAGRMNDACSSESGQQRSGRTCQANYKRILGRHDANEPLGYSVSYNDEHDPLLRIIRRVSADVRESKERRQSVTQNRQAEADNATLLCNQLQDLFNPATTPQRPRVDTGHTLAIVDEQHDEDEQDSEDEQHNEDEQHELFNIAAVPQLLSRPNHTTEPGTSTVRRGRSRGSRRGIGGRRVTPQETRERELVDTLLMQDNDQMARVVEAHHSVLNGLHSHMNALFSQLSEERTRQTALHTRINELSTSFERVSAHDRHMSHMVEAIKAIIDNGGDGQEVLAYINRCEL